MKSLVKMAKLLAITALCAGISGCDDVRVYGSVGYSSYNGYGGGFGTSVRVGGRIY